MAISEEVAQTRRSSQAPAEVCKARLCHVLPAGTWASHQGPLSLSLLLLRVYEKSSHKESEYRDTERPWMNVELLSSVRGLCHLGVCRGPRLPRVKNPPADAGDVRDSDLIPGSGRSPGGGHGNPLHYSCLENSMDRGAWWATVHRATKSRT